jgi:hypothetical protein
MPTNYLGSLWVESAEIKKEKVDILQYVHSICVFCVGEVEWRVVTVVGRFHMHVATGKQ